MATDRPRTRRRLRFVPLALAVGVLSSAVLGLSATGTLSAFSASITNTSNTAAAGSLVMKETDSSGNTLCLSSTGANNANASCTTDLYGGTGTALTPTSGTANTTTIRMYNTGNTAVNAFTLAPGTCTTKTNPLSTTGDLCTQLTLTLTCAPMTGNTPGTSVTLINGVALSSLTTTDIKAKSGTPPTCVPPTNGTNGVQFQFIVQFGSTADNTVQGQSVSQSLLWTYTGA